VDSVLLFKGGIKESAKWYLKNKTEVKKKPFIE